MGGLRLRTRPRPLSTATAPGGAPTMAEERQTRLVSADVLERSLSLAVEVRDVVTGERLTNRVVVAVSVPSADPTTPDEILARSTEPSASGFFLFVDVDLPPDPFTVTVSAGEQYADASRSVFVQRAGTDVPATLPPTVHVVDTSPPVWSVALAPTPAYEFPPNLTVARGFLRRPTTGGGSEPETVSERAARGVAGAELTVTRADETAPPVDRLDYVVTTTASGEFALPVPLGGPVETVTEEFAEPLDAPVGGGPPPTRPAYRRWVVIDDADPILSVRHESITPNGDGERAATLALRIEPETTTRLDLELDGGSVSRL